LTWINGKSSSNNPHWVIVVQCLNCQHRGVIAEGDLVSFGVKPGAPVAQFVKRLRCRKCGSGSVMAQRTISGAPGHRRNHQTGEVSLDPLRLTGRGRGQAGGAEPTA
jgi:hypothetical protein